MKKRIYIGVVSRPTNYSAAIHVANADADGSLSQSLDLIDGDYMPDRSVYPTIVELAVKVQDPTSDTRFNVDWTQNQNSVSWSYSIGGGTFVAVTALSTGEFTVNAQQQLVVRHNVTVAEGGVRVRADGVFYDALSKPHRVTLEEDMPLTTATVTDLYLLRDTSSQAFVGNLFTLNPLRLTTAELTTDAQWKKVCAVQLTDGSTPIPDAFGNDGDGDDSLSGTAFYFWFYRSGNRLIRLTEDVEWFDADWYASGTVSKRVTVDLHKIQHVKLVCRAGFIPYGQLVDYVDEAGILSPDNLYRGYRETEFELHVEIPNVQRITVADMAYGALERNQLANGSITVIKRALVTAGGTTLNDLTEMTPHAASNPSFVEKLYTIEWLLTKANGQEVSIGTGEWLQITPAQLATLYGAAINADAMPTMSVNVEPRYPKLTGNNYVEGYVRGAAAVTPSQQQGNKGFLKQIDFWLLDTTDNTGTTTHGMKLQRNNILRFAGGGWAPAVRISPEMAADAELELWRKNGSGSYVKYCDAGAYDPESYVESVLRPYFRGTLSGWYSESDGGWPRLYKKDGANYVEAHAVLPWETTETKYTTGVGFGFGVYLLDHQKREGGDWEWNGIFTDITEWDGIDFSRYYLPPTAFSPGPSTQITENGKTVFRNFFYLVHPQGGIGGASAAGILGSTMFNESGRAYPKVDDVNVTTNASRARANNSVATRSYPFAEGGFHTLNTLITSQELLYSRRTPFLATMFGSGISSNDACNSEATWRQNGGFRHKVSGASVYGYGAWSASLPVKSATNSTNNASSDLNGYGPKEQCMESQLAASFAVEFGIAKTTDTASPNYFRMYGGKYYWMEPDGVESLTDGYMNVRVYRELSDTLTGYDSGGSQTTCDFTAILRMSLMGGMNLSGDIFAYTQGGAEVIGECTIAPGTSKTGNPIASYLIPDQTKWLNDSNITKDTPAKFTIEDCADAIKTGEGTNLADGYYAQRIGYSPIKAQAGGGLSSYECCYGYTRNEWATEVGKRVRIALRFRGFAIYTYCSPRIWNANYAASYTFRYIGGSAQALIGT